MAHGFVHGWAYDPLRPQLHLSLLVDSTAALQGLSGHPIADSVFTLALPPAPRCGFCLPLPAVARDGRTHRIQVKVADWQALPDAPQAELTWYEGVCFGEVEHTSQGYLQGWVGFREALPPERLPPVVVSVQGQPRLQIRLTPDPAVIDGCRVLGKFRIEQSRLAALDEPTFSCLERPLFWRRPAPRHKIAGSIERLDPSGIKGWLFNTANPQELLDATLEIDGLPYRQIRPHVRRADIARQLKLLPEEIALCGFDLDLPLVLQDGQPHRVTIRCKADGKALNPEPIVYRHKGPGLTLDQAATLLPLRPEDDGVPATASPTHDASRPGPAVHATRPTVSIIILNRNGAPCLDGLFASFERHNSVAVEFIVFDHASRDDSVARIRHWATRLPIRLEALDRNFSFSASCNQGARLARAPHLLFLNNDIVWLQDALPAMLDSLQAREVGLVGLKLLKTAFDSDGHQLLRNGQPEVQHLGVGFTLVDGHYWPFEMSPETVAPERQYSPQDVPGVTGAVLLCRRKQFLEAGGFDEGYVYGYEDVEFCLRLRARQGLRSLCRNDLVALHHHGYTRLTGREPAMFDHQRDNQQRLASGLGPWLKRQYWQSLLDGDGQIASEPLTIGFAVEPSGPDHELATALGLAQQLRAAYPSCRPLFLCADRDWDQVGACHVLVALNPHYDPRTLQYPRGDLRLALYVDTPEQAALWLDNPGLPLFDRCLHANDKTHAQTARLLADRVPATAHTPATPLGDLLDAGRLRVLLRGDSTPVVTRLWQALRSQGALVTRRDPPRHRPSPDAQVPPPRVADVVLHLVDTALLRDPDLKRRHDPTALNILWVLDGNASLRAQDLESMDQVWLAEGRLPADLKAPGGRPRLMTPTPEGLRGLVKKLQQSVDAKIGRTFHSS